MRLIVPRRRGPAPVAAGAKPLKTLERALSKAGVGSRSEARRIIHAGRVQVNGSKVENPDHWVDLAQDRVSLDGRPLRAASKIYVLLYKPAGYVTTRRDPEGRPTVYNLLGELPSWVFPVGRLDLDTSGLLLLTNDTQFGERMTNPVYHITKTYLAKTASRLTEEDLEKLRRGLVLGEGPPTLPAQVRRLRDSARHSWLEIKLREGRNRQLRRMIEAVGSRVLKLVRISIGPITIGRLQIGRCRVLTGDEVAALRAAAGRGPAHRSRGGS